MGRFVTSVRNDSQLNTNYELVCHDNNEEDLVNLSRNCSVKNSKYEF